MKFRFWLATAVCLSVFSSCNGGSGLPALAQTNVGSVRRVSIAEATGQTGTPPPLIELSPGYGVNISFIPTRETVEKVWFDNPSFATLDANGCLSGLGGVQQQCQRNGASVLHLRRINPLTIPGLPKTNSSLLTVITSGSSERRVYLFQVTAGGGSNSQYHTVEVTPASSAASNAPRYRSVVESVSSWQILNRGLTVATQQRLVRQGQPLFVRIQNFLARVKAGEPIESAATASGISLNLVKRLDELGRTNSSVPAPAPVSSSHNRMVRR